MHHKFRHLVILLFFFISCSKTDPIDKAKSLLSGYSGGQKSWQLTGLTIGGQVQTLGPNELKYTKTYFFNGKYADTDAYEGEWRLDSETEILEVYNNQPTGLLYQNYTIAELSSTSLVFTYLSNGENVTTTYTAVK